MSDRGRSRDRKRQLLIDRARAGDQAALGELIEACGPVIAKAITASGGIFNREDREDAEQEAFLEISSSFSSFTDKADPCTWMYTVAGRVTKRRVISPDRRQREVAERLEGELAVDGGRSDRRGAEELDDADQVAWVLSALHPDHAQVLAMHYLEELSYEQISERLYISSGTVASRLNRAKRAALYLLRKDDRP